MYRMSEKVCQVGVLLSTLVTYVVLGEISKGLFDLAYHYVDHHCAPVCGPSLCTSMKTLAVHQYMDPRFVPECGTYDCLQFLYMSGVLRVIKFVRQCRFVREKSRDKDK